MPLPFSCSCCITTPPSDLTHSFHTSGWWPMGTGTTFLFCNLIASWTKTRMSKYYSNSGPCSQQPRVKLHARIYSPSSLSRVPCRLGRCVMKAWISGHMNIYNWFEKSRYGFCKRRSCLTNLLESFEDYKFADKNDLRDLVYMNFQKVLTKQPWHKREGPDMGGSKCLILFTVGGNH